MLSVAREAGFQVSGVDPNRAAVAQARARGFEVELATIETSSLPDRAFDVVFHVDMLNHFPDPICALEAMRRRLRPGGVLVFEVGVIGGLHPRWHWWWGSLDLPEHRQFFSEAALRRLLERAGLEVIETQRFGLLLASVVLRARRLVEPLIDRHLPRPRDATGLPPRARGIHAIYEYVMMATRYSIGRRLPAWGTLTLFVAAREKGSTPN
jgi:SAM-dependent methyltransferase